MFSRLTRLPLRRCLHTVPGAGTSAHHFGRKTHLVIGASVATATYLTWQLTREENRIALDSSAVPVKCEQVLVSLVFYTQFVTAATKYPPSPKTTQNISPAPSEHFPSSTSNSTPEPPAFLPDEPSEPSEPSKPEPDGDDAPSESETPEEGGAAGGAFNPVTGEINWDCPCLGGMAHGPCGPEFREAFSCFVFSEADPKGINCVDKFQNMQNCFRAHPAVYADGKHRISLSCIVL
jgi:mitochondrial intermembrane space import and assembly protein 40